MNKLILASILTFTLANTAFASVESSSKSGACSAFGKSCSQVEADAHSATGAPYQVAGTCYEAGCTKSGL